MHLFYEFPQESSILISHATLNMVSEESNLFQRFAGSLATIECSSTDPLVIDDCIAEHQQFIDAAITNDVFTPDCSGNGIHQISSSLAACPRVSSAHIVAHMISEPVQLRNGVRTTDSLSAYQNRLFSLSHSSADTADTLIHSYNAGDGESRQDLTEQLGDLTGANITAPDDLNNTADLIANWDSALATGLIETGAVLEKPFLNTFGDVLETLIGDFTPQMFLETATSQVGLAFGDLGKDTFGPGSPNSSIIFPVDAGVFNVLDFGAIPNDDQDDTAAIQRALNQEANGNRIIYLPDGEYLVSSRLDWPTGTQGGFEHKRTILQGESRDGTSIKLIDNTPGYQDPANPQAVVWTGTAPAQRFRNAIRDLTINTGSQNPGAIGIQFIANNQGGIRNVKIVSEDGQGVVGLDMKYTNEIGPLLVKGLQVNGFDYGIQTYWNTASVTFEDIQLENQNILGWENFGQTLFIRGLKSTNAVTALKNLENNPGLIMMVDSELMGVGDAATQPAILNQRSMFLRNITTSGYAMSVSHQDKGRGNSPGLTTPSIGEWLSHGNAPLSLFEVPGHSLNLPIQNTPVLPWNDLSEWVSPLEFGGQPNDGLDDSIAIQAAIDSGASTVYLPNGVWNIENNLEIRANVSRFLGTEARLIGNDVTIHFDEGIQPIVQIERLDISGTVDINHDASRTLVLSSISTDGRYFNTGTGDLFIDDMVGGPFRFTNQNVWARQLNQETNTQITSDEAKIINDGGNLWVLGLKTERAGTIIKTLNGGKTEVLGGFIFSTEGEKIDPAFVNEESSLSLAGVREMNFNGNRFQTWVSETRNGETRNLTTAEINLLGASLPPLYIGY